MSAVIDPAQAAWATYAAAHYFTRENIQAAHAAFIAAWHVGWSEGYEAAETDRKT